MLRNQSIYNFKCTGSGTGSVCEPHEVGHWKGRIASIETIHGEIDVMMFFPVNGPSGTYSHFCMSRIDQSFMRTCVEEKYRSMK